MGKRHKWADVIVAWSEGAEIEWRFNSVATGGCGDWENVLSENPVWHDPRVEYRIKPQPKESQYLYVYQLGFEYRFSSEKKNEMQFSAGMAMYNCKYVGKIKLE